MTAEIVVMNKVAVALAADSAVTVRTQTGDKIYNTANKLYMLSRSRPVGIMVYGSAELMGVPWETIIKCYRRKLADARSTTLARYAAQFIKFLDYGNPLFPQRMQEQHLRAVVLAIFKAIKSGIVDRVKAAQARGPVCGAEIGKIVEAVVSEHRKVLSGCKDLPHLPPRYSAQVVKRHRKLIDDASRQVFEKLPMTGGTRRHLVDLVACFIRKDKFTDPHSGVVVAGFGESENFPSVRHYWLEGVAGGRLKYKEQKEMRVDVGNDAAVQAFAQSEMVTTFMEGINPFYSKALNHYLAELIKGFSSCMIDKCIGLKGKERELMARRFGQASEQLVREFKKGIDVHKHQKHVAPIIRTVAVLPKDELAAMAESLVNLTSFKRRVTLDSETVGGPIDVAVISKGDGFVWIKRKHYFKPELNPHFVANYYKAR